MSPSGNQAPPRPRDPIELAKLIGDIATRQVVDAVEDGKDIGAAKMGRKGAAARNAKLSGQERSAIAKSAAQTLKCSPAMAAGVTTKLWELSDMVKVLEDWEAKRSEKHATV
jgi:hypothetical protein